MSIILSMETVNPVLDELVKEFGEDYVYPGSASKSCYYTQNGEPSCLVGQVLFRLGASIEMLDLYDSYGSVSELVQYDTDADSAFGATDVEYADFAVIELLQYAQEFQDGGYAWSEAVKRARENV